MADNKMAFACSPLFISQVSSAVAASSSAFLCKPHSHRLRSSVPIKTCRSTRMNAAPEAAPEAKDYAKEFSFNTAPLKTVIDNVQIQKILPHRYPFLLVDKVVHFEAGKCAVGVKNISINEPQFTGHFPDRPIMPGVLMIEAMAQVGGIVALQPPINEIDSGVEFFFAGVDNVKWRKPVVPGDTLVMQMEMMKFRARFGIAKMNGRAYVDGELAVEGEFTFAFTPQKK